MMEGLLRAGLGFAWLLLPLLLGLANLGRILARRGSADRLCALVIAGWIQVLVTFELLGTFGWLSFWSVGLLQWAALAVWLGLRRRAARAAASHASGVLALTASASKGPQQETSRHQADSLGQPRPGTAVTTGPPGATRTDASSRQRRVSTPLVLLVLGLSLGPWLRQLPMPPVMEDTLTYHMSFPAEWIGSGELRMPVQHDADNGPTYYPFAAEVVLGWWMLTTGSDQFATVSAWLCLPILLVALVSIGKALKCSPLSATASWAFLCSSPLVIWLTVVGFNDLPLACALLLAMNSCAFLALAPTEGRAFEAGAALGLVAAVKYSGLALGAGVALLGMAGVVRAAARMGLRRGLFLASLLVLAAVLAGGYPYARNLVLTGSPVYPAHLEVFGIRLLSGLYGVADWIGHPHHQFDWGRQILTTQGSARNGWLVLTGLLPLAVLGIPLACKRAGWVGGLLAVCGWVGLAAFWKSSPYRHDPRFFVPAIALIAAAATPTLDWLAERAGRVFEPALLILVWGVWVSSGFGLSGWPEMTLAPLVAVIWLAEAGRPSTNVTTDFRPWIAIVLSVTGVALAISQANYLRGRYARWEPIYEGQRGKVWKELNQLSPASGVTVAASGTSNTYPLYGSDLRNRVLFVPRNDNVGSYVYGFGHPFASVFEDENEAKWLTNLERLGVGFFVLGPARCPERAWIEGHPERFELRLEAGGYALYSVGRPEA